MPTLVGAPAYARPPRTAELQPRPLDPDDLPLEAERTPEEQEIPPVIVPADSYVSYRMVGYGPEVRDSVADAERRRQSPLVRLGLRRS
jgi:hypothetical protein